MQARYLGQQAARDIHQLDLDSACVAQEAAHPQGAAELHLHLRAHGQGGQQGCGIPRGVQGQQACSAQTRSGMRLCARGHRNLDDGA